MKTVAYVLFAASLLASGCRTDDCKTGTVFLDVELPVATVGATEGAVLVSVAGGASTSSTITLPGGKREGGIEVDFASKYPAVGTAVLVTVSVVVAGVTYAATTTVTTTSGCSHAKLDLVGAGVADLGSPLDMTSPDAGVDHGIGDLSPPSPDLAIEPPDFAGVDLLDCMPETTAAACAGHVCGNVVDNCDHTVPCGACELYSVSPSYAESAKTVDLEGTFDPNAIVNFPGGATAIPTVMGAHRLRVAVPSTAMRGTVTVTSNGSTTNAVPFARTTYQSTFARFTREYPQTSVARVAPQLAVARALAGATVLGGAAYVVGGINGSGLLASVDRATVNADGTLGAFKTLTAVALNTARSGHRVVTIGSTLHVVGGRSTAAGVPLADEYATIGSTGALGTFTAGNTTKLARYGSAVVVAGKWLYVIGGSGDTTLRQVERAPILPGGLLGAFDFYTLPGASTTLSIPADLVSGQAYVVGNTLNLVGGCGDLSAYVTTLDTDGNITQAFTSVPNVVTSSACGAAFVRIDGSAYLIGGADSDLAGGGSPSNPHDNIFIQQADSNAAGAFTAPGVSAVPDERMDAVGFSTSSAYYVCGGVDSTGAKLTSCTVAQANTSSGVEPFAVASLGTTSNHGVVFAAGPYVYLLGTVNGDILRATVTNDVLGPFADTKLALSTPVTSPSVLVAGDDVYIMGGSVIGSGSTDIEHAMLDASGLLPAPMSTGSFLGAARMNAVAAYVGPNVYVDGGVTATGDSALTTRDSATASDGSIGPFRNPPFSGASNSTDSAGLVVDYTWYILSNMGALSACLGDATGLGTCAASGTTTYSALGDRASVLVGRRWLVIGGATLASPPVASQAIEAFLVDNGALDPGSAPAGLAKAVTGAEAITIGNSLYVLDTNNSQSAALK